MESDHSDLKHVLFLLGLSLLVGHELDAVTHREWLLLPLLNALPDDAARIVFVTAHVPLLAALVWLVSHRAFRIRRRSQVAVDCFLVIHAGLHLLLSGHELYTFEAPLEGLLVYGGAGVGLAHLIVLHRSQAA